jgi:hypothetical protein
MDAALLSVPAAAVELGIAVVAPVRTADPQAPNSTAATANSAVRRRILLDSRHIGIGQGYCRAGHSRNAEIPVEGLGIWLVARQLS